MVDYFWIKTFSLIGWLFYWDCILFSMCFYTGWPLIGLIYRLIFLLSKSTYPSLLTNKLSQPFTKEFSIITLSNISSPSLMVILCWKNGVSTFYSSSYLKVLLFICLLVFINIGCRFPNECMDLSLILLLVVLFFTLSPLSSTYYLTSSKCKFAIVAFCDNVCLG